MASSPRSGWSQADAEALLGRRVRTRVAFSGLPAGTSATVTQADPGSDGHTVALQWDLPGRPKPLVDWFRRAEWDRSIELL